MDRDFDIERAPEERPAVLQGPESPTPDSRQPEPYQVGPYRYLLNADQKETLFEVGRFRTVAAGDLARFGYQGRTQLMHRDIGLLKAQGLMQERHILGRKNSDTLAVLVLTKRGKKLLETVAADQRTPADPAAKQAFYSGFVKPAEVKHDAAIYRMFQAEKAKIEHAGARVRRVVLDYELKRRVYTPLAKAKPSLSAEAFAKRQAEVARENGLKVIGGKILLPDLRIEYETREGMHASVDLEVATRHYRGGMLRGKAEAGFKLYAPADSMPGIAAHDPEFMADILSF